MVDMHQKSDLILGSLITTDTAVLHVVPRSSTVASRSYRGRIAGLLPLVHDYPITRDLRRQNGRVGQVFDPFFASAPEYVKL